MEPSAKRPLLALGAVLVIIGSGLWMYHTAFQESRPPIDRAPLEALGQVAAEEAVQLAGPGDGSVVIITWDAPMARLPTFAIPEQAFETALKQHPSLKLAAVETVRLDVSAGPGLQSGPPPDQILGVLLKHADATVVVSFAGFPSFAEPDFARLPAKRPKVLVIAQGPTPLRALFGRDAIQAAITPLFNRPAPAAAPTKPQTPREWFDRKYMLVTPGNYKDYPG